MIEAVKIEGDLEKIILTAIPHKKKQLYW